MLYRLSARSGSLRGNLFSGGSTLLSCVALDGSVNGAVEALETSESLLSWGWIAPVAGPINGGAP